MGSTAHPRLARGPVRHARLGAAPPRCRQKGTIMAPTRWVGISLVILGLLLLVVLQTDVGAAAVPLFIGAGFMVAYAVTRQYGFLVPGGILTGLGAGIVADAATAGLDGAPVLGLGLGFLLILVVDALVRGRAEGFWWPAIPGGILVVVGLSVMPATAELVTYVVPGALILAGIALILGRGRPRPGHTGDERSSDAHTPASGDRS